MAMVCPRSLPRGDTLWHSLSFEFTVGMGVENSGHFAGFIPKEPFHPTVFPAEECVVLAGEKFDDFPVCPSVNEFVARSRDRNVAFVAAVDQSVVADVIVQEVARDRGRLPVLVGYVCFLERHQPPLAIFAREHTRGSFGCTPTDSRLLVIVGPVLRLIHNCDAAGKYHSNIFGLLVGIGMDVAFGFPKVSKNVLLPLAHTAIVGRDIAIVHQSVVCSHITIAIGGPYLVAGVAHCLLCGGTCNRRLILLGESVKRRQQDECDREWSDGHVASIATAYYGKWGSVLTLAGIAIDIRP